MNRSSRITAIALSALVGAAGLATATAAASASPSASTAAAASPAAGSSPHSRLGFVVVPPTTGANSTLATVDDTGQDYQPIALTGAAAPYPSLPAFSHDGKHVAFLALTGAGTADVTVAVFVANADGSDTHVVVPTSPDPVHMIINLVWSADDSTLYLGFDRNANAALPQLWQVGANGTGLELVPGLPSGGMQIGPEVLADGRLVYSDGLDNAIAFNPKTKSSATIYTKLSERMPFTLSADGKRIAVTRPSTTQGDELDVSNLDGTGFQTIESGISVDGTITPMAWSPDGSELAYEAGGGITVRDLAGSRPDVVVSAPSGSPANTAIVSPVWESVPGSSAPPPPPPPPNPPPAQPTVHRIGGDTRYDTARQVSAAQWQAGKADAVVLARGDAAPDALAGVPLAARVHGPLLLTNPATLDTATRAEIDRVLGGPGSRKTVYILGGATAVSPKIEGQLRAAGYTVVRYGGVSRFDTALKVAQAFGTTSHVIVATGWNFPDALSAGPLGAAENAPIVLSDNTALDPQTAAFVLRHQSIDPIGGQAQKAVAALNTAGKTVDHTLAGTDRYATSAAVAARVATTLGHAPTTVGVASGTMFPDALTGGAYIANAGGALLLTDPAALSGPARATLHTWLTQLSAVEVFGGRVAVSDSTLASVVSVVGGRVV
jgi:hypothetical protein